MEEFLPFLQKYEVWIYVLLGAIAVFYVQKLIMAWRDWQGSVFGIEREIAQRRFSAALTVLVLLVLFVTLEFVIVSFVAPSYPQLVSLPTPTLDLLATPTATLPSLVDSATSDATAVATTTLDANVLKEGCEPGKIEWISPKPGEEISGTVELIGTVNVPNLGFYTYEYADPQEKLWHQIAAGNQPKVNGQIGFWNTETGQVAPGGEYLLRLVVSDNQTNLFPACVIPVKIKKAQ